MKMQPQNEFLLTTV